MTSTLKVLALALASLVVSGCESGRENPPNATVRVLHAAPDIGTVVFKRVSADATPLDYKQASVFSFDVDDYTFNFEILALDGSVTQTLSLDQTLNHDTDYTMVVREIGGQPQVKVIESPARDNSSTGTQLELLHAATTVGAVDVFVEPTGFDLAAATPWGTLNYDEELPPRVFSTGNYELVLTEAGVRSNVLLRSQSLPLGETQNSFLFIADGADTTLAPITVSLAEDAGVDLVDQNLQSGISVLNAVSDRSTIDAGIDLELSPPLIPGVAFANLSDQALIAPGDHNFNVTPAGNMGVIEIDQAFGISTGRMQTWLVTGAPGALSAAVFADEFRVLAGESKLRLFDGSTQYETLEIFFVAPGTDISTVAPTTTLASGAASSNVRLAPGDYELTVRDGADQSVLAGPQTLTLAADGYYAILLSDALGGTGVEAHLLYDFN